MSGSVPGRAIRIHPGGSIKCCFPDINNSDAFWSAFKPVRYMCAVVGMCPLPWSKTAEECNGKWWWKRWTAVVNFSILVVNISLLFHSDRLFWHHEHSFTTEALQVISLSFLFCTCVSFVLMQTRMISVCELINELSSFDMS